MRHGWHLHGGWEGVQAALALQRLAGLLQVCDSGRGCYICIAASGADSKPVSVRDMPVPGTEQ